jgi:hypothetical protein
LARRQKICPTSGQFFSPASFRTVQWMDSPSGQSSLSSSSSSRGTDASSSSVSSGVAAML